MSIPEKYLRHQQIHWLSQEKLFRSKVLVVGVGAVGNELIKNLALLGVGYIFLVDLDRIEIHNLPRSVLFTIEEIGKPKVEVAKEKIKTINPDIQSESYMGDVYDLSFSFFKNFDCIISTVDNYETRIRLHQLSFFHQVDFINSGIDSQYVSVELFPYSKNRSLCFECSLPYRVYQNIQKRYSCGWIQKYAFEQKQIPTTIVTSSLCASLVTSVYVHRESYQEAFRIFLDSKSWNFSHVNYKKNPECFFCSLWSEYKIISKNEFFEKKKQLPEETSIFCNEPILVSLECPKCKTKQDYWELSRKFTDKDLFCKQCNFPSPKLVVKDSFSLDEIDPLRFLLWKYLYYFSQNNSIYFIPND